MVFYKPAENEFFFQLANLEVREDFSIWDNNQRRFIRQMPDVQNFDDLKFMKQELFQQRYPEMSKVTQYVREVLVIGTDGNLQQYSFGFKKSANDQLEAEIRHLRGTNRDPMAYNFKYRKTGSGLATTHVVVLMQEVGIPSVAGQGAGVQGVVRPNVMQAMSGVKPSFAGVKLETPQQLTLNPQELQIMDLFNADTKVYSEADFVQTFNATSTKYFNLLPDTARVKLMFKTLYKK